MKILFVIEHFYPYHDASAKVLRNLLLSNEFNNHELHVLSIGDIGFNDGGIEIHNIPTAQSPLFKLIIKLRKGKFVKNKRLIRQFKSNIEKVCYEYSIEHVVYVLGNMNLLIIKPNIKAKQSFIFYDSLLDNFFFKKEKNDHIIKIQSAAFKTAFQIFLLDEYLESYKKAHKDYADKFNSFYITAFYNDKKILKQRNHVLLHSGAFFPGLREPNNFFDFLNYCDNKCLDLKAITLGQLPNAFKSISIPKNLEIKERIFGEEYNNLIESSECLVLVDNCKSCNQIPSKTYEYIGYDKKILFFTCGGTNTSKLLMNNKNVFKIDGEINDETINLFSVFLESETVNERQKYYKNERDYTAHYLLERLK